MERLIDGMHQCAMRFDLPGIEAFLGVAHRGSFRRAAAEMNLSQAALSHRVKKLEEALGTSLLSRTTRHVALTEAGLELLPVVERAVAEVEEALASLREHSLERAERLAIGCLPTLALLYLPSALAVFSRTYPTVKVQIYDNSAAEIENRVRNGSARFGVTVVSARTLDSSIELTPLARDPFLLVCPVGHPLSAQATVQWSELEGEALIRISAEAANRLLIDEALGRRRETMRWRFEVQRVSTAIGMVQAGLGLTVLPRSGLEANRMTGLVGVKLHSPAVARSLGILSLRDKPLPPEAALLARLVGERLKASAHTASARRTRKMTAER